MCIVDYIFPPSFFPLRPHQVYSNQKRKFRSSPTWESLWYVKNTNVTSVNFRRLTNGSSDLKQSWTPLHVIWSVLNVCSSNQFFEGQNFYTVNEKLLINVFWANCRNKTNQGTWNGVKTVPIFLCSYSIWTHLSHVEMVEIYLGFFRKCMIKF